MHLLREGQFGVASTFLAEASNKPARQDSTTTDSFAGAPLYTNGDVEMEDTRYKDISWTNDFADSNNDLNADMSGAGGGYLQSKFTQMYRILHALRNEHDLEPAIGWARQHSEALELRGSNLEFELCRLRFVELYNSGSPENPDAMTDGGEVGDSMEGPLRALSYARETFVHFSSRYMRETAALLGSLAFSPQLNSSPYKNFFYDTDAWNDVSRSFVREFCGMLGLSEQSPLYTAVTAGGIALPVLEKLERVMGEVGGQWSSVNELPVRCFASLRTHNRSGTDKITGRNPATAELPIPFHLCLSSQQRTSY